MLRPRPTTVALAACAAGLTLAACGSAHRSRPARPAPTKPYHMQAVPPGAHHAPSVWRRPLPVATPVDPRSPVLVRRLIGYMGRPGSPWIDDNSCAPPVYTVPAGQPAVRVVLDGPPAPWRASLQAAFDRVPIPAAAHPSSCPDHSMVVRQPSTNHLWELWHLRQQGTAWHADWGGASDRLRTNPGYFGPGDWPGAGEHWGVSASGLTLSGGLLTLADLHSGKIDHALALSIPEAAAGVWTWPAQRTDGVDPSPTAIPYGTRFRLAPGFDLSALDLPPTTLMIARAVQRYGFIVREQTHSNVQIATEAPPSGDPAAYRRLLGGDPGTIMRAFPWSRLQALPLHPVGPRAAAWGSA